MAGTSKSIVNKRDLYNNDFYLVKLESKGNIIWQKTLGGSGSEWGNAVHVNEDGDLIVLGYTNSAGMGSTDVCLIKVKN